VKQEKLTHILLSVVELALVTIATKPAADSRSVASQSNAERPSFIERGVLILHISDGSKNAFEEVVVDRRTGNE